MGHGKKVLKGVIWSGIERLSKQSIQFVVSLLLAYLLSPDEYGIIGLILVFIAFANIIVESGFTKALIQKIDRTPEDVSTAFFFNLALSLLCYAILFFAAPLISDFYEIPVLNPLLRVLALSIIINALYTVPATLLVIRMDFRSLAKINLIAIIISGSVAVGMAYYGYGVWALVGQTLVNAVLGFVLTWLFTKWRPIPVFSRSSFKSLFSFGSNLLFSSILNRFAKDISYLLVGKVLSTASLGYYTRGVQFSDFVSSTVSSILDRVLLPGLADFQHDLKLLTQHIKTILKTTALITVPLFFGLFVMAEPIILVILSEKWANAIPIMQIFCIARLITIIVGVNINLLYVLGKTNLVLRQQYLKIAVRLIALALSLQFGIVYIALGELISTAIHYFINSYYPGKIMGYGAFNQLKDISRIGLAGVLMALIVYGSMTLIEAQIAQLIAGPVIGALAYYGLIKLLKIKEFDNLLYRFRQLKQPN